MRGRLRLCALVLVLLAALPPGAAPAAGPPASPPGTGAAPGWPPPHPQLERAIQRQRFRQEQINLAAFLDTLGIAPGSTVLDIGAGPGYASFLLAERLRGGGRVYATDIRRDFVDYVNGEAARRGLDNLTAVAVSPEGLDPFYGRQRYDLVLLSNVYHALAGRVAYFTGLRAALAPGGRLVLVLYNQAPEFTGQDFVRLEELARSLAGAGEGDPFAAGLSGAARELVRAGGGTAALREALAADFNRMLRDPGFHRNFYRDSYFVEGLFGPAERDFANWLLMELAEEGALDPPAGPLGERALRAVIALNRLFFMKRFGDLLAQGGRGVYLPIGDANRNTSKRVALRELDAAGYRPVGEARLSAYYDALIMAPKAP